MFIIRGMTVIMMSLSWQMTLTQWRILILAARIPIVIVMGKLLILIQKLQDQSVRRVLTTCRQFRATARFAT